MYITMSFSWCMKKSDKEYRPEVGPCDEFLTGGKLTEEDIVGMLKSRNKHIRRHVESLIYHTEDKELRMRRGWLMYRTYHPRMPVDWCRMCSELTFDEWYGKEKDTAFSYATDDGKAKVKLK